MGIFRKICGERSEFFFRLSDPITYNVYFLIRYFDIHRMLKCCILCAVERQNL